MNYSSQPSRAPTKATGTSNLLAEIIAHKRNEVEIRQLKKPLANFQGAINPSTRSFKDALSGDTLGFILECKKASPSKGLIRQNFDLNEILGHYEDFASAVSILTDTQYFQGQLDYLTIASQRINQPILCKDFFVDAYQVYEARHFGADAILLMLSVLDDASYRQLATIAKQLNLDILTEVHTEEELDRAIALNAAIIGINNRNLKTLEINLSVTQRLAKKIPADRIVISESGIHNHNDVLALSPFVDGFLIGSSIMAQDDIRSQCKSIIYGPVKICGITQPQDAIDIDRNGGIYAGFIFYPKSKRYIDLATAEMIRQEALLRFVGVFVDEPLDKVVEYADRLKLHAVQLHGHESDEYIEQLKKRLGDCEIWQALKVVNSVQLVKNPNVDHYLLDSYSSSHLGGSGESFDWQLLSNIDTSELILAGGIDINSITSAANIECYAIDISSGAEIEPGVKSADKIAALFYQLRRKKKSFIGNQL